MAQTQCLQCTGTFDDSNRFCPGCGCPSFTQATVATNTGSLPSKAQTQTDRNVTMQDLVDNVLDAIDAVRENRFLAALTFACVVIVYAAATSSGPLAELDRLAIEQQAAIHARYHAKEHWERMRAKDRLESINARVQTLKAEAGKSYMTNREFSQSY